MKTLIIIMLLALPVYAQTTHTTVSVEGNQTITGNKTFTGTTTLGTVSAGAVTATSITNPNLDNRIYVDGVKYPLTHAGIQQALTDACAITNGSLHGTQVLFPPMAVTDTTSGGACFTVTCPLDLEGAGEAATGITATACNPMFLLQPSANFGIQDWRIRGFTLNSGGGDVIKMDGVTNGFGLFNYDFEWNEITAKTGSYAITTTVSPTLFLTQQGLVAHNTFGSGVKFNGNATGGGDADGLLFDHNYYPLTGTTITTPCLDLTTADGTANDTITHNQFNNCAGGVLVVHGANQLKFINNQVQLTPAITEANSAILDFQGDVFAINQATIQDNNINALTSGATSNIRLDHVTWSSIANNVFTVTGTTGAGIRSTSNASKMNLDTNNFGTLSGGAVAWAFSSTPQTRFLYQDSAGNNAVEFTSVTAGNVLARYQTGGVIGFTSGNDTNATAIDTGITRCSAGVMCVTNSETPGNHGGAIEASKFITTNLLLSATAPTISSGFGTSPSIASNNGTASFTVNVGTGGTASSGVIGLPTATNGWNCTCQDTTTFSTTVFLCRQTASSTTTATIGNFNTSAAAAAWVASDVLNVSCFAR